MHNTIDGNLSQVRDRKVVDRRNGSYHHHLLTELGDLEHKIPHMRTVSAISVLKHFARRLLPVERLVLLAFLLGLSTRKVAKPCCRFWENLSVSPPSVKLLNN